MTYFSNFQLVKYYSTLTAVPVIETNKVEEFASGSTSSWIPTTAFAPSLIAFSFKFWNAFSLIVSKPNVYFS